MTARLPRVSTLRHGGIDVDVPDGWSDQSNLVFVAPGESPETISIRFTAVEGKSARELAHAEIAALSRLESHVQLTSEGAFMTGLGEAYRVEIRVLLESVPMTQVVYAVIIEPLAVIATATAMTDSFEATREKVEKTIASLRPAR
jgi:hypothetical protein